jgi:hypothetical protein
LRPDSQADLKKDLGLEVGGLPSPAEFFDEPVFLEILEGLIGQSKWLQNNPKLGVTPEEARAAKVVLDALRPYSTENGGPLKVRI